MYRLTMNLTMWGWCSTQQKKRVKNQQGVDISEFLAPMAGIHSAGATLHLYRRTTLLKHVVPRLRRSSNVSSNPKKLVVSPRAEYLGVFGSGPGPTRAPGSASPPQPGVPRRPPAPPPVTRTPPANVATTLLSLLSAVVVPIILSGLAVSSLSSEIICNVLQLESFPSPKIGPGIRSRLEIIVTLVRSSPDLLASAWVAAHGLAGLAYFLVMSSGGWARHGGLLVTFKVMVVLGNAWVLAISKLRWLEVAAAVKGWWWHGCGK